MQFKLWLEFQQLPVMYHGSPTKRSVLQAGSMLTTNPVWAAGYTTRIDYSNFKESITGVVHEVHPNPSNAFTVSASLHGTEDYMIKLGSSVQPEGSGLTGLAKAIYKQYGYDMLVSKFKGEIVGAITLVDIPVARELDPVQILKSQYPNIPDNLKRVIDSLGVSPGAGGPGSSSHTPGGPPKTP